MMDKWDEALGEKNVNTLCRRIKDILQSHGEEDAKIAMDIADVMIDDGHANLGEILAVINARFKYQVGDWVRIQLIGFNNQPFTAQAYIEAIDLGGYYLRLGSESLRFREDQIIERIPREEVYPS